jgi:DNA replication protein DnaC
MGTGTFRERKVARRTLNCWCPLGLWKTFCENVPKDDRFSRLSILKVSDMSTLPSERQEKILATLRSKPLGSYAFFGPAGTGKTTLTVALYREALRESPLSTWRMSAKDLLEEYVDFSMSRETPEGGSVSEPTITRRKIKKAAAEGCVPRLFLEEIDKVKWTEFKINSIFEIFDSLYENEGQLVFTTNLTPLQFNSMFGAETGPAISRRVTEMCKVYDLFPQ